MLCHVMCGSGLKDRRYERRRRRFEDAHTIHINVSTAMHETMLEALNSLVLVHVLLEARAPRHEAPSSSFLFLSFRTRCAAGPASPAKPPQTPHAPQFFFFSSYISHTPTVFFPALTAGAASALCVGSPTHHRGRCAHYIAVDG